MYLHLLLGNDMALCRLLELSSSFMVQNIFKIRKSERYGVKDLSSIKKLIFVSMCLVLLSLFTHMIGVNFSLYVHPRGSCMFVFTFYGVFVDSYNMLH